MHTATHRTETRPRTPLDRPSPRSRWGRVRPRPARVLAALLLGLVLATGTAVLGVGTAGTSPAWADPGPTPAPAPTPAPGVPDPGVPHVPNPSPSPPSPGKPTPSPIPAPPTGKPSPTPPGTPSPAPGPTPPGWTPPSPGDGSDDDPGLFDIPGQIRKAINDFLAWIAKTGLKPVMDALGKTVLSTPDLTSNPQVQAIWTTSLVVANGIFVLFVIAGGFIVASRETLQSQYGLKEIAPRVVVAGVAANTSLLVCGKAIAFTNALTAAIAGQGVDGNGAVTALDQILNQPASPNMPPILFSLLILAALVMGIVVLVTFILRTAMLVLLLGVAPLALTCHATPQTEGLAYTWWRALVACLGIQLGQAVILLATVRVFLTPAGPEVLGVTVTNDGLISILVCLTMLWLLIKLPGWMKHLILGPLARRHGRGLIGQIIHAVIMLKTLGTLAGVSRGASAASTRGRSPRSGPSPSGPSPAPGGGPTRPTGGPRPPRPPRPPRQPGSGRPRTAPAPVGPAAFSNAPAAHAPLSAPAGSTAAPVFSSAPAPATPVPAPAGGVPPARFSHQPAALPASSAPAGRSASAPAFSSAPASAIPTRPATGPVPPATFSAAPRPQAAPKRPPAPLTPVFSAPGRTAAGTRSGTTGGTAPARPVPAVAARPRRIQPPSPRGTATGRRVPSPSPAPSPRGTASSRRVPASSPAPSPPSRSGRPSRAAPSPPVPPSPPPRPRGKE